MENRQNSLESKLIRFKHLWRDSYIRLRISSPVVISRETCERSASVAIPFYNNSRMGHLALFNILSDRRISEVVMLDDFSQGKEFEMLKRKIAPFRKKITLYRREKNWGAFATKIQAVSLCKSEWVILLDYDNTLTNNYLDAMFAMPTWEPSNLYCSDWAFPNFSFKKLSGSLIDFDSACEMANNGSLNGPFFNDGNYLVPRNIFVETLMPYWKYSVAAADVIFANYIWLSHGGRLSVVKNSRYIHRVHRGSTWIKTKKESQRCAAYIKYAFRARISPNTGWIDRHLTEEPNHWIEPRHIPLR